MSARVAQILGSYISIRRRILQVINACEGGYGLPDVASVSHLEIDYTDVVMFDMTRHPMAHNRFRPSPEGQNGGMALPEQQSTQTGATTGLTNSPSVSIRQVTTLPAASVIGGLRKIPTPAGVPVEITSPGSRVISSLI